MAAPSALRIVRVDPSGLARRGRTHLGHLGGRRYRDIWDPSRSAGGYELPGGSHCKIQCEYDYRDAECTEDL